MLTMIIFSVSELGEKILFSFMINNCNQEFRVKASLNLYINFGLVLLHLAKRLPNKNLLHSRPSLGLWHSPREGRE